MISQPFLVKYFLACGHEHLPLAQAAAAASLSPLLPLNSLNYYSRSMCSPTLAAARRSSLLLTVNYMSDRSRVLFIYVASIPLTCVL